jgi:hypothetical protein
LPTSFASIFEGIETTIVPLRCGPTTLKSLSAANAKSKCVRKALGQDIIPDVPKFDGYLPLNCGGLRPGREKRDRQYQKNV